MLNKKIFEELNIHPHDFEGVMVIANAFGIAVEDLIRDLVYMAGEGVLDEPLRDTLGDPFQAHMSFDQWACADGHYSELASLYQSYGPNPDPQSDFWQTFDGLYSVYVEDTEESEVTKEQAWQSFVRFYQGMHRYLGI